MQPPNPSKRTSSADAQAQALLKWRWLAPAVGLPLITVLELIEGHALNDPHLYLKIFTYGLTVPFVGWLLLTILARTLVRSARNEERFEQHQRFTLQLSGRQDWGELTKFVTKFPGTILPLVRASLYTYDHQQARFEFVTEWNSLGVITFGRPFVPEICVACLLHKSPRGHGLVHCPMDADDHCLPLIYDSVLVGALQLKRRPGQTFSQDQIDFMISLSPEIALAMALLIAQPRQMAQAQVDAQIKERRRITYDLHDSLAQQIGYLHLALDRLTSNGEVAGSAQLQAELEQMRLIAGDAYERIRTTLSLLRTQENADLVRAIAEYAATVSRNAHLQIDVVPVGEPLPIPPTLGQNIFNLVREGLNNVEKHARASRAQIDLIWSADNLHLILTDNGVGFDASAPSPAGHYGLAMIFERVAEMRGEFKVESSPGQGTRLHFKIPFRRFQTNPNDRSSLPVRDRL
jgi:signal transduction histidine kinase